MAIIRASREASDQDVIRILEATRTVAVLGAHPSAHKAAHYVPDYLHGHGYRVLPVNPNYDGELWGESIVDRLADLTEPVDLVDVFRLPRHLPAHLPELLAMSPLPKVVWFQSGIRHERVAQALREAGMEVVQDRCTLADHRRLLT